MKNKKVVRSRWTPVLPAAAAWFVALATACPAEVGVVRDRGGSVDAGVAADGAGNDAALVDGGTGMDSGVVADAAAVGDAAVGDVTAANDATTASDAGAGQDRNFDAGGPGGVLWTYPHGLQAEYAAAIGDDGTVYVQGQGSYLRPDDPTVVAIGAAGEFLWGGSTSPGSIPAPPVLVTSEMVVAPATFNDGGDLVGRVYRFALDGTPLPTLATDGPIGDGAALLCDDIVIVPSTSIYAFQGETSYWSAPFSLIGLGKSGTNVAIGPDGNVYVGARGQDTNLYALTTDGTELWRFTSDRAFIDPLAVDADGRVYSLSAGGLLRVFEAGGTLAWSFQAIPGSSGGGPVVDEYGVVYFGVTSAGGFTAPLLFAVEEAAGGSGRVVWNVSVGFNVTTTPALSQGGTLYVSNSCGIISALQATDGAPLWSFTHPDQVEGRCAGSWSAPAIGADGTVYASIEGANDEGTLYAFVGDGTGPRTTAPWPGEQGNNLHHSGFGSTLSSCPL